MRYRSTLVKYEIEIRTKLYRPVRSFVRFNSPRSPPFPNEISRKLFFRAEIVHGARAKRSFTRGHQPRHQMAIEDTEYPSLNLVSLSLLHRSFVQVYLAGKVMNSRDTGSSFPIPSRVSISSPFFFSFCFFLHDHGTRVTSLKAAFLPAFFT